MIHQEENADSRLYRTIVESMGEAAVVIRKSDGRIVYGNGRFAEMVGCPAEGVVGASLYDFLPEGERERFESTFCGEAEGGRGEFTVACSENESAVVRISGGKAGAAGREGVCLVMTDITVRKRAEEVLINSHEDLERRVAERTRDLTAANERLTREMREREQAEAELRESEEHFRRLIENALDIVMVLKADATIAYAGPSVKRVLGYGAKGLVNRSFLDFVHPSGRAAVAERIAQAGRIPGFTMSLEADLKKKDDGWRTVEMICRNLLHDRAMAGIVVNGRDITEHKHMEGKLRRLHDELEARVHERTAELRSAYERLEVEIKEHREAEEERARLALAIEQGGDCVIITDGKGVVQYMNPASEKVTLYRREEVTGRPFDVLKGGDGSAWDEMWAALREGQVWTGRVTNRKKDGSAYEVERTMSPIRDNEGAVTNYVSVERDMTRQVGLEAELRQAQKMQAIGTLAGGIAHDFNNILAAVIGFTELAVDDVGENTRAHRHLAQVRKAGYRGRDLVKQMLAFSRQGEHEKKAVQVAPIVAEVGKLMRASLPSTIEIKTTVETDEGIVLADPVQIHQLLINLCTNAGQAMKATKGRLEVRLADFTFADPQAAPHPDMEPDAYVMLSVSDTGSGVDEVIKDRIYEPFFTTGGPGKGLGLSVVYGIVKGHGGAMTMDSAPGSGSTFTVYLKKLKEAVCREAAVAAAEVGKPSARRCILFVDDEEALVEMGKQMLERLGYEVIAESDSMKALKRFQRNPARFDLVITDQTMPNMTGIELAKKLMSIKKDIPVILCTGFSEVISPETAKSLGIREFVMKPIIRNEMAETIERVIAGPKGQDVR
jgi:PAS domain S-box-containing protein